jgi:hypothetical protein
MKRIVLLACLLVLPPLVQAGEYFRWVDKSGMVNYGDVLPAGATDVERIKISSEAAQYDDLPYETRRALQNFPVTLYVAGGCDETCDQARSLLNKRGIPYSEKMLRTKEDFDAFKQLSGLGRVVPVLAVGKNFLKGFLAEQWNSELDIAGYPKTASYRPRPAPAAAVPAEEGQSAPAEPAAQ